MNRFLVAIIALFTGILITMPSFHVCEHGDAELDHICDYCFERITECEDAERDHICDLCGEVFGACEDADKDHYCDHGCGIYFGVHEDTDLNHACDHGCKESIGSHADENKDHACDYGCAEKIGACRDNNGDRYCDYGCGKICGSEGLSYSSHGDGTCYVSGIGSCDDAQLVIPEFSPSGDRVVEVASYAFYNCDSFTSVVIPDSVTSIGSYAFYSCDRLMAVEIGDGVTSIQYSAFEYCANLTSVVIPDSVTSIESWVFDGCVSLTGIYYCGAPAQWDAISKESSWNYNTGYYTIIYYFGFAENTYTFESNGGSDIEAIASVVIDILPVPTKENFYFDGWYETADFSGTAVVAPYYSGEDITLYAKWLTEEEYLHSHDGKSLSSAFVISDGDSATVMIDEAGEMVYYKIVPTVTGSYTIYSQGDYDTCGYLYDAFGSQIDYNDDGGNNSNFSIFRDLMAGETYYIGVKMYSSSRTGSFTLVVS